MEKYKIVRIKDEKFLFNSDSDDKKCEFIDNYYLNEIFEKDEIKIGLHTYNSKHISRIFKTKRSSYNAFNQFSKIHTPPYLTFIREFVLKTITGELTYISRSDNISTEPNYLAIVKTEYIVDWIYNNAPKGVNYFNYRKGGKIINKDKYRCQYMEKYGFLKPRKNGLM